MNINIVVKQLSDLKVEYPVVEVLAYDIHNTQTLTIKILYQHDKTGA